MENNFKLENKIALFNGRASTEYRKQINEVFCEDVVYNRNQVFVKILEDKIPMNRLMQRDGYKGPIIFSLSEASSYLNSSKLSVDGGRSSW